MSMSAKGQCWMRSQRRRTSILYATSSSLGFANHNINELGERSMEAVRLLALQYHKFADELPS